MKSTVVFAMFLTLFGTLGKAQEVSECTFSQLEPIVRQHIQNELSQINPQLDMSTLAITPVRETPFYNVNFHEYSVTVQDHNGRRFSLATFRQARRTGALGNRIGGLFVSEAVRSHGHCIGVCDDPAPTTCDSQYLGITSLFISNSASMYATRLIDASGHIFRQNDSYDIFDLSLRAASAVIRPAVVVQEANSEKPGTAAE